MEQAIKSGTQVGVIADTHGLLRPEAIAALTGSDLILHAGDIGKPEVLAGLQAIPTPDLESPMPVIAIQGNVDKASWAEAIPEQESVKVADISIHMLHILQELKFDPQAAGFHVVISGHSHKPLIEERKGVLYVNPGSAGPKRFKLPISVARLSITGAKVRAEIIQLAV
ncbi:metallophosphoesterase family protein [Trichocoleus sp. FACHB-262]|uniref:metallophosphoesterase family protein n=1 Tax=Trichocoleus sp. FACHB-262 TaxID=2692869 RepID=UPI00168A0683|nr:metallophosphoesterase family protein [Trichocoleus sp. FACHB-262]MBD2124371.1 metallophosphoesterase family protein [Trichocoleus sp. FACHB-262]